MFSKSELEIMSYLWAQKEPRCQSDIVSCAKSWKKSSALFLITGLVKKGAVRVVGSVKVDANHFAKLYEAAITQEDYAAQHISAYLPNIDLTGIVTAFAERDKVSRETIQTLRAKLEELEASLEDADE